MRIYGATGHGKGLIDAMSSFCAKAVLRQDIVTKYISFQSRSEICDYLECRCDSRMSYFNLDAKIVNEKRLTEGGFKICSKFNYFFH